MTVPEVMDIDTYTAHVVAAEMPSSWPAAALQAQAIAARTYALATTKHDAAGYNVCCDSHCCQGYREAVPESVRQAVEATAGIIGLRDGALKPTYYSARCGGRTLNTWGPGWLRARYCPCSAGNRSDEVAGHRQGLCQWGSYFLAVAGYSYREILDYYYILSWMTIAEAKEAQARCRK